MVIIIFVNTLHGYLGVAVGILLMLVCILLFVLWQLFPYIYGYIQPLNHSIEHGDCSTLISHLNCVSKVKPGNRPIVIVREIIANFEPNMLQETEVYGAL